MKTSNVVTMRKPVTKAAHSVHHVNLRCPEPGCEFYAKTTRGMLRLGRLECPVHDGVRLETKAERGETRGRRSA